MLIKPLRHATSPTKPSSLHRSPRSSSAPLVEPAILLWYLGRIVGFGRTTSGQFGILSHQVLAPSRIRFWYFQGDRSHLLLESHNVPTQQHLSGGRCYYDDVVDRSSSVRGRTMIVGGVVVIQQLIMRAIGTIESSLVELPLFQ